MKLIPIFLLLFLASCSPLRHYQYVKDDPFRNSKELKLLLPPCAAEFPFKESAPVIIGETIDSTDYEHWLEEQALLLMKENDSLKRLGIDTVERYIVTTKTLPGKQPPPIIKTITKEIKVLDKKIIGMKDYEIAVCRTENDQLYQKEKQAQDKLKARSKSLWIFVGVSIFLLIALILSWVSRIKKIL